MLDHHTQQQRPRDGNYCGREPAQVAAVNIPFHEVQQQDEDAVVEDEDCQRFFADVGEDGGEEAGFGEQLGHFDGEQASGDPGGVEEQQVAVFSVVHVHIAVEVGGGEKDGHQDQGAQVEDTDLAEQLVLLELVADEHEELGDKRDVDVPGQE